MQAAINKTMSDDMGGDPEAIANEIRELKSKILGLMPRVAFRLGGIDKHLNTAYRSIDSALSEAIKQQQNAVAQKPINFSGALGGNSVMGGPPAPTSLT